MGIKLSSESEKPAPEATAQPAMKSSKRPLDKPPPRASPEAKRVKLPPLAKSLKTSPESMQSKLFAYPARSEDRVLRSAKSESVLRHKDGTFTVTNTERITYYPDL